MDGNIKYAKRTGFIDKSDNFFNYKSILDLTQPKILHLIDLITNKNPLIVQINVYGELFGGIYPVHNKLDQFESNFLPIQKVYIIRHLFILLHLIFLLKI